METSETKQNKAASVVIQTAVILFGLTVYAAGVVLFILPLDMIAAGTTGLGLMAQHFFGIPLSGFVAVFNIAMFGLVGEKICGDDPACDILLPVHP